MDSLNQTPASQNPYPQHPYTQNFPEEPESESLQATSFNNDQQYYPPQIQESQTVQSYGLVQDYIPPDQYGMVGNQAILDQGKRKLEAQIRDLEGELEKGWYAGYLYWLYTIIITSVCIFLFSGFCLIVSQLKVASVIPTCVLAIINSAWLIQQALMLKNAINGKNLEAARRGLRSMTLFVIFYFGSFFFFIGQLDIVRRGHSDYNEANDMDWYRGYFIAFIGLYITPLWVNIFGAKKVIDLLEKREEMALKLKTQYSGGGGSNLA